MPDAPLCAAAACHYFLFLGVRDELRAMAIAKSKLQPTNSSAGPINILAVDLALAPRQRSHREKLGRMLIIPFLIIDAAL